MDSKKDIIYLKDFTNSYSNVFMKKHCDHDYENVFRNSIDYWSGTFLQEMRHLDSVELTNNNEKLFDIVTLQTNMVWSLLKNRYADIVQEKIFVDYFEKKKYFSQNSAYHLFEVTIFARMYYIAYYEKDDFLKQCKLYHLKEEIVEIFKNYGDVILENLKNSCRDGLFTIDIIKYLHEDVYHCETSMICNDVKSIVSDKAVDEFVILTIATSIYDTDSIKSTLKELYGKESFHCYNVYARIDNKEKILARLQRFIKRFKIDENINGKEFSDKQCESCYERLRDAITQIYVEDCYKQVIEEDKNLDEIRVVQEVSEKMNLLIEEKIHGLGLNEKLNIKPVKRFYKRKFPFLFLTTPVHFVNSNDIVDGIHSDIESFLISSIIKIVKITSFNICKDGATEEDLIDFLSDIGERKVIIGSNPLSYLRDYRKYGLIKSILDQRKKMVSGRTGLIAAINMDDVRININNIQVEIKPLSDKDISEQIIVENDKFFVNVTNDINLPFEKEMAEEYLKKDKRKVEVYCDIDIVCDDSVLGDCIIMKDE